MTVRKLSISVPAEVEETIKAAAAEAGKPVSAWLAAAGRRIVAAIVYDTGALLRPNGATLISSPCTMNSPRRGSARSCQ